MRSAWLAGLVIFCLVASGWILVQGRGPEDEGPLVTALVEQASEEARGIAAELDLARGSERGPSAYYVYTDDAGTMRFVGSLAEVPAAFRDSARPVSNDRVQRAPAGSAEPRAREERALEHEVVVYTTSWCGWCRKTLAWLDERGVAYENRDIERDADWAAELQRKTGTTAIPVVDVGGSIVRGFDPDRLAELL
jgi:glutaredoxin